METSSSKGLHILMTLETSSAEMLTDCDQFITFSDKLLLQFKVEIVGLTHHIFDNGSFTAAICLKESHLCIHTWPEFNQLTFDIFLCNYLQDNTKKVEEIADSYKQYFKGKIINEHKIYR